MTTIRWFRCAIGIVVSIVGVTDTCAQSLAWARAAGGLDIDSPYGIAVDGAGNSYITGIFAKSRACISCGLPATFGAGQPNETVLAGLEGSQDIFVAKYDISGALVWARRAGGTGPDEAWGIAVDSGGNSYITGISSIGADFGNGVTLPGNGAFVVKYDSGGNTQWATSLEPIGTGFAIAVDGSGNTYVSGYSPDPTFGGSIVTLWKVAASGQQLWSRQATGLYFGVGNSIAVDSSGNSHVTGLMNSGTATFGPGEPNETTLSDLDGASNELFVAKYDSAGNLVWAKQSADIPGLLAYGTGISVDGSGNSYLTGFGNTILGRGEANETALPGDNFVAKYDVAGQLVWAKNIVGRPVEALAVATDAAGNAHITGTFATTVTFAPGEPNQTLLVSLGGFFGGDMFVAKYGANGGFEWARQAGPGALGRAIALDPLANIYVAGSFAGESTFGPGEVDETVLMSAGTEADIFVARYLDDAVDPNQAPVATDQSVTTPEDTPVDITLTATDADNDPLSFFVVTGPAHGTLSPSFRYTPAPNYNGPDSFTFHAYDGQDFSNTATVSIIVTPVNDPPVAHNQQRSTPRDTPVTITLTGDDVDGDPLTFNPGTGPSHGTLNGTSPTFTYTPAPGYVGPDSFTFTAFDGLVSSAAATVTITVDPSTVACGVLTSGSITAAGEIDRYSFNGVAGQIISVALASTAGFTHMSSRSATLTLLAPSGAVVGTLRTNSQVNFLLPASGTYTMQVSASNRTMTGSYNLNVECLVPPSGDAVVCGALTAGRIDFPGEVDQFSFAGQSGQILSVTLASSGGFTHQSSRSAVVKIFGPAGDLVISFLTNSQRQVLLPATGPYIMQVSASNLTMTGSYNLNVECLLPTPSPDAVPLTCGALGAGTIDQAGDSDLYSLTGQSGAVITLTLTSTAGFVNNPANSRSAELMLFGPSGTAVGTARSGRQVSFTVLETGLHVIRVGATNIVTTGSYTLALGCGS